MDFEQRVRFYYEGLTESEKEMVQYLMQNKGTVIQLSIVELGDRLLSSKSSVLRLAKKLGYHGFSEMKYAIQETLKVTALEPTDLLAVLQDDIQQTFRLAEQTNFQPLLQKMKDSRMIFMYASGFSQNNYTKEFGKDLFLLGKPNMVISGETNLEMSTQLLTPDDLLFITSLSGETPGIKDAILSFRLRKIPICSVTLFGKNFLSQHADYTIYYEGNLLPAPKRDMEMRSMIGLDVALNILMRKYHEFILYDE